MHSLDKRTIDKLADMLSHEDSVAFSLLFGSAVSGRLTVESDVDVGVYFVPTGTHPVPPLQIEEAGERFSKEYELQAACERIVGREVDLVVLNRAPAGVAAAAMDEGILLSEASPDLRSRFYLLATDVADSFAEYTDEYLEIRRRSHSLSSGDRRRLIQTIAFLSDELTAADRYSAVDRAKYLSDAPFRRELERWVENVINASIDIGKIVAASAALPPAKSYRESLENLVAVQEYAELSKRIARNVRVRNVLAHEYLDIRFDGVKQFTRSAASLYSQLVEATESWMARQDSADIASEGSDG